MVAGLEVQEPQQRSPRPIVRVRVVRLCHARILLLGTDVLAYEVECVIYDNEGDRFVTEDYDEWRAGRRWAELRPYANAAGEVDFWRLELTLNELGRAFLVVDQFAREGGQQLTA